MKKFKIVAGTFFENLTVFFQIEQERMHSCSGIREIAIPHERSIVRILFNSQLIIIIFTYRYFFKIKRVLGTLYFQIVSDHFAVRVQGARHQEATGRYYRVRRWS